MLLVVGGIAGCNPTAAGLCGYTGEPKYNGLELDDYEDGIIVEFLEEDDDEE